MIFLGLGTNMGDRVANMEQAYQLLEEQNVKIIRASQLYESPAWGITEQAAFLNNVCEVSFEGSAHELLTICLHTETQMGRKRIQKWGPRLIDIDVLEFNRLQMDTPDLLLPHPYYPKRDFVLVPFAELSPNWKPTGLELSVQELITPGHQIYPYTLD